MLAALVLCAQIPKPGVPSVPIRAEMRLTADRPSVAKGEDPGYHVTIRNLGRAPLRLSDLQSGSWIGAVNPSVDWIAPDLKNAEAFGFCGNHDAVETRRFFTLAPGASRALDAGWLAGPDLSPGVNRVSLVYTIDPKMSDSSIFGMTVVEPETSEEKARMDAETARILAGYRSLTPIRLKSNVVRVTLRVAP